MTSEHGSAPAGDGRSGLAARFVQGVDGSIVELVLEYDGLEPPLGLFAELDAAGWTAPVPVPPPSSAIDWARPDPATGKAYSVNPYRAECRSRPQSRAAFAAEQVRQIVDRHRRDAPQNVAAPAPLGTSPSSRIDDSRVDAAVVVVTLPPERADAFLGSHPGLEVVRRTPTTRQVIATYRGRPSEVTMPAVELEVRAGMATIRSVLQTLRDVEDVRVRPLT